MSPEELRVIRESARRATNDARDATMRADRAQRVLRAFGVWSAAAREEMLRRRDRAARSERP